MDLWMCVYVHTPFVCVSLLKCICTYENITAWTLNKEHVLCVCVCVFFKCVRYPSEASCLWGLVMCGLYRSVFIKPYTVVHLCVWVLSCVTVSMCVRERDTLSLTPLPYRTLRPPPWVAPPGISLLPPPGSLLIFLYQSYQTNPFFCPPSNMPCQICVNTQRTVLEHAHIHIVTSICSLLGDRGKRDRQEIVL